MNGRRWPFFLGILVVLVGLLLMWQADVIAPSDGPAPRSDENLAASVTDVPRPAPAPSRPDPPDAAETPSVVQPPPARSISGRVYDAASGKGLERVNIYGEWFGHGSHASLVTDADGSYRIENVGAGNWSIRARGSGVPPGEHVMYLTVREGKSYEKVDFSVELGLTLSGVVIAPYGQVEDTQVHGDCRDYRGEASCNPEGRFLLSGFAPGDIVNVVAWKVGFGPSERVEIVFTEQDVTDVRLTLEPEASIAGVVVDPAGRPVAGAMVLPRGPGLVWGRAGLIGPNTDQRGMFRLGGLCKGEYKLTVERYRSPSMRADRLRMWDEGEPAAIVTLRKGEHKTGLRLVLPDDGLGNGRISGTVRDAEGRPLERAQVWLESEAYHVDAFTDAAGQFAIEGVADGVYAGTVAKQGYQQVSVRDVAVPSEHAFVLHVGEVRGKVINAQTGLPIPAFSIARVYTLRQVIVPSMLEFQAYHDDQGTFSTPASDYGETRLMAVAPGYAWKIESVHVAQGGMESLEFRLEPGATIKGTVVDPQGQPVAEAQLFVGGVPEMYQPDQGSPYDASTFTAADGSFCIDSIPMDITTIGAFKPGYQAGNTPLALHAGENPNVTIRLGAPARLEVRVLYASRPVANQEVHLNGGSINRKVKTDAQGVCSFEGIQPGEGTVSCAIELADGGIYRISTPVVIDPDHAAEVVLAAAPEGTRIRGNVAGFPSDARVVEVLGFSRAAHGESHSIESRVDGPGSCELIGLPAGAVNVRATAYFEDGATDLNKTVDLPPNGTVDVELDFRTQVRVEGVVRSGPVEAGAGFILSGHVEAPESEQEFRDLLQLPRLAHIQCDSDGYFELTLTQGGSYTAVLYKPLNGSPRYEWSCTTFEAADGETVQLELTN